MSRLQEKINSRECTIKLKDGTALSGKAKHIDGTVYLLLKSNELVTIPLDNVSYVIYQFDNEGIKLVKENIFNEHP